MARKRLIALLTGLTLLVPLPAAALEATAPVATGTATTTSADSEGVTVPLPGVGEVSVAGSVDPAGSGGVAVDATVAPGGAPASAVVRAGLSASSADGLQVDAAAPVTVLDTTVDPVERVVAPVADAVRSVTDQVAPGVVPDVRPAQPGDTTPVGGSGGGDVRSAALPAGPGGLQERVMDAPTTSVGQRRAVASPAARDAAPTDRVVDLASEPAARVAGRSSTDLAGPRLPDPVAVPTLLRVLAALLVIAAGFTNRVVARELR